MEMSKKFLYEKTVDKKCTQHDFLQMLGLGNPYVRICCEKSKCPWVLSNCGRKLKYNSFVFLKIKSQIYIFSNYQFMQFWCETLFFNLF